MKTLTALLFTLLLPFPLSGQADTSPPSSPEALVRQVTDDVLTAIRQDKALQAGDRQKALALAEQKVLPHVDFAEMTRLAAGRTWNTATAEQRERLTTAFRTMLIRTYASAIDTYRGQTMKVDAMRVTPDPNEATVRNRYLSPGREATIVDYAMRKTPEGWKIYDIVVEGVSLALTYRAQFTEAARNGGIENLIQLLEKKAKTQPAVAKG